MDEILETMLWIFGLGVLIAGIIGIFMFVNPIYSVWSEGKYGESELARAEFNKQIAVREAEARMQSALFDAKAEVERAKGVAEANQIIGDSLKGNEEYLRYLFIDQLRTNQNREIIYVPTEANLPILESTRNINR